MRRLNLGLGIRMIAIRTPNTTMAIETYSIIHRDGKTALVRTEWRESLEAALFDGAGHTAQHGGGRAPVVRFVFDGGRGVLKTYRRGGMVGRVMRESYVLVNRARRELTLLDSLYGAGLPVPQPLGALWQRRGPIFRGALATRELPARDLIAVLSEQGSLDAGLLRQAGRAVRALHDEGVFHADLNARNVLVSDSHAWVIDFDNARRYAYLNQFQRACNLLRLRRSLQKNGIAADVFDTVCSGYGIQSFPSWLDGVYRVKGALSDVARRRKPSHVS